MGRDNLWREREEKENPDPEIVYLIIKWEAQSPLCTGIMCLWIHSSIFN